jgi:hypothetical protein
MRDNTIIQAFQQIQGRIETMENRLGGIYKVLEEIVGKELLRGQALHKVLMDKAIFTDAELKTALDKLVAESKAELEKMKTEAQEAKQKAVELLVPAGANLTPPTETQPTPTPEAPAAEAPKTEGTNGPV